MIRKAVYFDNNATTRVAPEVRDAMLPFLDEFYANPSSIHRFGGQLAACVEEARTKMAALLGAEQTSAIPRGMSRTPSPTGAPHVVPLVGDGLPDVPCRVRYVVPDGRVIHRGIGAAPL